MKKELQDNLEKWKKEVQDLQEFELFLAIDGFGGILWRESHDYSDGRIEMSEEVFKENQEYYYSMQKECLPLLKKFGVDPDSAKDRKDGNYWKWHSFWKKWMNSFNRQDWIKFEKIHQEKKSVEEYLPKTKWNE